ncbi:hypothetical protein ScPMuIL_010122 [Solemya velum]
MQTLQMHLTRDPRVPEFTTDSRGWSFVSGSLPPINSCIIVNTTRMATKEKNPDTSKAFPRPSPRGNFDDNFDGDDTLETSQTTDADPSTASHPGPKSPGIHNRLLIGSYNTKNDLPVSSQSEVKSTQASTLTFGSTLDFSEGQTSKTMSGSVDDKGKRKKTGTANYDRSEKIQTNERFSKGNRYCTFL